MKRPAHAAEEENQLKKKPSMASARAGSGTDESDEVRYDTEDEGDKVVLGYCNIAVTRTLHLTRLCHRASCRWLQQTTKHVVRPCKECYLEENWVAHRDDPLRDRVPKIWYRLSGGYPAEYHKAENAL
ncbi:unnamed protein product [Effrenium voratum]|nr:unnamed protein product [Effrenium voratum]